MAELRDSLLRALAAHLEAGHGLAVALSHTWRCCPGAIADGPTGCTCWVPEYDPPRTEPSVETVVAVVLGKLQPEVRDGMCRDCAYRPNSPERSGDPDYQVGPGKLDELARESRFYCHDGMSQPVAWRHHIGLRIPAPQCGDYQPVTVDGVPYRANGQPGLLCAGWDARRRALTAEKRRGGGEQ